MSYEEGAYGTEALQNTGKETESMAYKPKYGMQTPTFMPSKPFLLGVGFLTYGRLIFIHLRCWEVLPFCRFQRQRCIKIRVLRAQDFYTPLALKTAKGQHLPALEVYKSQSPNLPSSPPVPVLGGSLRGAGGWLRREGGFPASK